MRSLRLASLATALGLITAAVSMGSASAATPGVGTSIAKTTVAQLDLGDLLSARILGDDSRSSIDQSAGTPEAATVLRPLTLESGVIDALNLTLPEIEVRTTGAENRQEVAAIDLDQKLDAILNAVPALGDVAPSVVSGVVAPASLAAVVDAAGARSGLNTELFDLAAGGGLVSVESVTGSLGTDAASADTDSVRGLDVDTISALNLGALLDGLGIPLTNLSVDTVAGLLDELGLLGATGPVADLLADLGLPAAADATALTNAINGVLSGDATDLGALDALCTAGTDVIGTVDPGGTLLGTGGVLNGLPGVDTTSTCAEALAALQAALPSLDLLGGLLGLLDGMSLLSLDGITAGIVAKATDSVQTSAANVTATIGGVSVGGVEVLQDVDLIANANDLTNLAGDVVGQLDTVLGLVGTNVGDLAGILDVKLLDTTGTGVTKTGDYVQSVANLTGVNVTITPPANLAAIITDLAGGTSVLEELTTLNPAAEDALAMGNTDAMRTLENALTAPTAPGTAALVPAGATNALAGGASLSLASISGTSNFVPRAQATTPTPTGGELPRTGTSGKAAGLAAFGMVLGALALGIRRHVLAPVRIDNK